MASVRLITDAGSEPVTTAEAKAQLRIPSADTAHDTEIADLITQARTDFERDTGRAMIDQDWTLYLDTWPHLVINLPRAPVSALTGSTPIQYYDEDGNLTSLDSSVYVTDFNSEPARIVLAENQVWPTLQSKRPSAIEIDFTAGYGSAASDVPETHKRAILLLVEYYFDREANMASFAAYQRIAARHKMWNFA